MRDRLPAVVRPMAPLVSGLLGGIIGLRNWTFDRGWRVRQMPVPVISVGNLSLGGSGKTPMVMWIVERLREAGYRPVIAMRGYGPKVNGRSDEHQEYLDRLGEQTPIVAQPNRSAGIRAICASDPEIDCCVLDDGFQHRMIDRTVNLVTLDATRDTFHDRLLPMGYLRERPSALNRATGVVVTRAEEVDEALAARVKMASGREPLAWTRHVWTELAQYGVPGEETREVSALDGLAVVTATGVGHPESVQHQLQSLGAQVIRDVPLVDHQAYTERTIEMIGRSLDGADALLMTAKDWVKCRHMVDSSTWVVPVLVPRLRLEFLRGGEFLEAVLVESIAKAHAGGRRQPASSESSSS